ncbi:hypothetical protein DJ69_09330 [Halorubrum persicum]|uniref:Uncharacterized protein n=1 Tax=Halorubrum persicum TaxID=1383844 RepID=A0A2G1WIU0_9EURY|nr:hypothetical protein DJ69_09330 [Halorubrum persicum]
MKFLGRNTLGIQAFRLVCIARIVILKRLTMPIRAGNRFYCNVVITSFAFDLFYLAFCLAIEICSACKIQDIIALCSQANRIIGLPTSGGRFYENGIF